MFLPTNMNKGRKITGGKYHSRRKKKSYERTNQEKEVTIGEPKRRIIGVMGGNKKAILLNTNIANVTDGKILPDKPASQKK